MAIRKMPFADADRKCSGRPVRDGRRLCCFHLSHFRGLSVPGGGFVASTCHGFLAFLCQVAALLFPPVTVSWHFRGRWAFSTSHLSHFRGLSVPGGGSAVPTCHSFAAFPCQVATLLLPPVTLSRHFCARWRCRLLRMMRERLNFVKKIYEKIWREKKSQYLCSPFRK